jgi:hypothetical protein
MVDGFDVAPDIAARLGLTVSELRPLLRASSYELLHTGRISSPEFWDRFRATTGLTVDDEYWGASSARSAGLVRRLRENSERVVAGTNALDAHYRIHAELGDYDAFAHTYASHLIHLVKPDPAFYRHISTPRGRRRRRRCSSTTSRSTSKRPRGWAFTPSCSRRRTTPSRRSRRGFTEGGSRGFPQVAYWHRVEALAERCAHLTVVQDHARHEGVTRRPRQPSEPAKVGVGHGGACDGPTTRPSTVDLGNWEPSARSRPGRTDAAAERPCGPPASPPAEA